MQQFRGDLLSQFWHLRQNDGVGRLLLLLTCTSKICLKLFDSESHIHGIILLTFQKFNAGKEVTDLIMGAAMGWRGVAGRGVGEE